MATTMDTLGLMAMEQQNLRQSIGWLYVEVEKLNEKFTRQEMLDQDFDTLRYHIVNIEKDMDKLEEDIVNLKEDIVKIWTHCAGTLSTVEKKDARIASLEKDIVNLKKEGEQTDARLARLEEQVDIVYIQNVCGGTYTLSGKSEAGQASAAVDSELLCKKEELEAKEKAEDKAAGRKQTLMTHHFGP